jgi:hypothetical protein
MSAKDKNRVLKKMASKIRESKDYLIDKNKEDLEAGIKAGLSSAMLDRLTLNEKRIEDMSAGIDKIALLTDPVGEVIKGWSPESGIKINKVKVPIGVIGMIFESRPNVTADSAALALKSGNAIVLRGGKEAINSNIALSKILKAALEEEGIHKGAISLIENIDRDGVRILSQMTDYVDVIICHFHHTVCQPVFVRHMAFCIVKIRINPRCIIPRTGMIIGKIDQVSRIGRRCFHLSHCIFQVQFISYHDRTDGICYIIALQIVLYEIAVMRQDIINMIFALIFFIADLCFLRVRI